MINQWGGPRPGSGRKPGQKNKTPAQGRVKNIIKQATFLPAEWEAIAGDMEATGFKSFTAYCRIKLLQLLNQP